MNGVLLVGVAASAAFFSAWWLLLGLAALPEDAHHILGLIGALGAVVVGYYTLKLIARFLARQ